jgi:hypothetical protein
MLDLIQNAFAFLRPNSAAPASLALGCGAARSRKLL